jgi:hypothetical protein
MQTKSREKVKRDRKSLCFNKNLGLEIEDPSRSSNRNYPQTLSLLKVKKSRKDFRTIKKA